MRKIVLSILIMSSFFSFAQKSEKKMKPSDTELWEPKVNVVKPGVNNAAPSDAIVLFDGKDLSQWVSVKDSTAANWHLNKDGSMTVKNKAGDIRTKQSFGSVQLHIEWKSPSEVNGEGQSRGNSGIFLQSQYEVQVLDNNNNATYVNGQVASIYKQSVPLVHAAVETGGWNAYDIIYHAPEFDLGGNLTKQATITVLLNGVLVQDHFNILGPTVFIGHPKYSKHGKAPLKLQDHRDNSRVSYRNIWVRELE
ncbi:DUF1080 domain-containing protein [Flavivirga aquimarina]|uniref:DUF1080 domain-containing protein n=1 Tax=Flavivirga aquimarina TaxID=2027862 RepID=A0ABT8WGQ3_9FLAO|nr:DUF1080 domain-containing protein [Flavivirga aquimarina]MDO5972334.1 DUF1080 domain-containing protein [Flavivirga aquimarina]